MREAGGHRPNSSKARGLGRRQDGRSEWDDNMEDESGRPCHLGKQASGVEHDGQLGPEMEVHWEGTGGCALDAGRFKSCLL